MWQLLSWDQWLILATGPLAIYCSQSKLDIGKWACILGLVGQIGWFYSLYTTAQWGGFISSFFYTYAWLVGVKNFWITKGIK